MKLIPGPLIPPEQVVTSFTGVWVEIIKYQIIGTG